MQNPPNFLLQAELRTYVTQEVVVPPEEDEPIDSNLVDTSETDSTTDATSHTTDAQIVERDNLIQHLQLELERLRWVFETATATKVIRVCRTEINRLVEENRNNVSKLQEQVSSLETELATKDSELLQERQIKEDLFNQASAVAQTQDSERNYMHDI